MTMGIDSVRKKNNIIHLAIWVKANSDSMREFGLLFFTFALFMGVVWISGKDVEPIVFVLGSISTLLFTSPALARYVVPDRKPVRKMSYDEILNFITASNAELDWKWIQTNWAEEAFLKEDPRLRIRVRFDDAGVHIKEFNEPWVESHPDTTATSYWYDLSYEGALIDRFILVSVDGGKAELPMPDPGSLEVSPLNYTVAQIFDEHNTLDEYMSSAGLKVNNSSASKQQETASKQASAL